MIYDKYNKIKSYLSIFSNYLFRWDYNISEPDCFKFYVIYIYIYQILDSSIGQATIHNRGIGEHCSNIRMYKLFIIIIEECINCSGRSSFCVF